MLNDRILVEPGMSVFDADAWRAVLTGLVAEVGDPNQDDPVRELVQECFGLAVDRELAVVPVQHRAAAIALARAAGYSAVHDLFEIDGVGWPCDGADDDFAVDARPLGTMRDQRPSAECRVP